jgi:tetratricopeptide (TPR) repeat protein
LKRKVLWIGWKRCTATSTKHPEIRKLLIQPNLLIEDTKEALHTAKRKRIKAEALEKLKRIEELLLHETTTAGDGSSHSSSSTSTSSRNKELKMLLYQRKGFCYVELFDFIKALPCFNTALALYDFTNKDTVKELFYNRADCKQQSGDLAGALEDFTSVFQRIGAYNTAYENIQKLERQLNVNASRSVLPRPVPLPDVDVGGDEETVRKAMANLSLQMPIVKLSDRTPERCSHCQRGGMKLAGCSACHEDKYCSKQCQVASWKAYHKYVCIGSKNRLDAGAMVTIQ